MYIAINQYQSLVADADCRVAHYPCQIFLFKSANTLKKPCFDQENLVMVEFARL